MNIVDLHVHSNRSDGSMTPSELVDLAIEKGLSAFALTDHDTVDGIPEALSRARYWAEQGIQIEVIPGIEFSTEYMGKDIHIVGIDIDYDADFFKQYLTDFVNARIERNIKMCKNLQEAGIDITFEKLMEEYPGSVITRAHYARFLHDHGYTSSMKEAFERYVGDHTKYFVPREKVTPVQAVELVLRAGGIPILAHPVIYGLGKTALDTLVSELKAAGLIGIEAVYSTYTPSDERDIKALALKHDLAISGGSDFHGKAKPDIDLAVGRGKLFVHEGILKGLRDKKQVLL
jgi:predicted metal-dependent phosphoesterase TrpH